MPNLEDLIAIAYKAELVLCRRMQKKQGVPELQALQHILQQAAGDASLAGLTGLTGLTGLIHARQQLRLDTAQKLHARRQASAQLRAQKKLSALPDPSAWLAWFDGSAHPNPGKMGIGGVLKGPDGQTLRISQPAGQGNSSEGEYLALIAVLREAVRLQPEKLVVYGDSQVVINDVLDTGTAGARGLQHYAAQARHLLAQLEQVTLTWIPRHRNAEADALSQQAIRMGS